MLDHNELTVHNLNFDLIWGESNWMKIIHVVRKFVVIKKTNKWGFHVVPVCTCKHTVWVIYQPAIWRGAFHFLDALCRKYGKKTLIFPIGYRHHIFKVLIFVFRNGLKISLRIPHRDSLNHSMLPSRHCWVQYIHLVHK